MDIKNELVLCREFFVKEEQHLIKCLDKLEKVEINLQYFSMKETIKNHLNYLKTTISSLSDKSIEQAIKMQTPNKIQPQKIWPHNRVEIRKGMKLQSPEPDDFPQIQNFEEIKHIKFYYRDPTVFKGGYGPYEFIRGKETYYVADNKKLYVYDTVDNMLKVGVYDNKLQYWK